MVYKLTLGKKKHLRFSVNSLWKGPSLFHNSGKKNRDSIRQMGTRDFSTISTEIIGSGLSILI